MSALGQKQTSRAANRDVCFTPESGPSFSCEISPNSSDGDGNTDNSNTVIQIQITVASDSERKVGIDA